MIHFRTLYKSPFLTQVLLGMLAFFTLPENQVQLNGNMVVVNQQFADVETVESESLFAQKMQGDTAFLPFSFISPVRQTEPAVQFDKKSAKSKRFSAYFLPPSLASPSHLLLI